MCIGVWCARPVCEWIVSACMSESQSTGLDRVIVLVKQEGQGRAPCIVNPSLRSANKYQPLFDFVRGSGRLVCGAGRI
eukprot:4109805-Prymnesium_polylepis.1